MKIIDPTPTSPFQDISALKIPLGQDENDVDAAIISGAETCPRHQGKSPGPSSPCLIVFRAVGMPLGAMSKTIGEAVRAQDGIGLPGHSHARGDRRANAPTARHHRRARRRGVR